MQGRSPTPDHPPDDAGPDGVDAASVFAAALAFDVARRALDETDASDIAQDIVLRLQAKFRKSAVPFASRGALAAWTIKSAAGGVLGWFRTCSRREEHELTYMEVLEERYRRQVHPAAVARVREVIHAVDHALADMPERRRGVFCEARQDGLSYREIAERRGISEETVHRHVGQAISDLRLALAHFVDADGDDEDDQWKIRKWYKVTRTQDEPETDDD